MTTSTGATKAQIDLHTRLLLNATAGISDSEANTRNSEHVNNMKWIAGHLLNTRVDLMSKLAGLQPDTSYGAQFGRGNSLDPNATYPPLEEITAKWQETSSAIADGISKLPEEVLAAKAPSQTPIPDDTIRGLVSFLLSHEAYHIGQLGLLRKMIGKEAMSYN